MKKLLAYMLTAILFVGGYSIIAQATQEHTVPDLRYKNMQDEAWYMHRNKHLKYPSNMPCIKRYAISLPSTPDEVDTWKGTDGQKILMTRPCAKNYKSGKYDERSFEL